VDNIPGQTGMKNPIMHTTKQTIDWIGAHPHLKDKSEVIKSRVEKIERVDGRFQLHYTPRKQDPTYATADYVILATGIMDRQPLIRGEMDPIFPFANNGDFIYCVRCDGHHTIGKKLSVLGHDDSAPFLAQLMADRYEHSHVDIFLHGEEAQFSDKAQNIIDTYGFTVYPSRIDQILGDGKDKGLEGFVLEDGQQIETKKCIITLGIIAYNELAVSLGAKVAPNGRVEVSKEFESSVDNLFVVGDLASGYKMQIYTGWDQAVDAADAVNRRVRAAKQKQP
jgi:thioredoxin reductase (NADPH)